MNRQDAGIKLPRTFLTERSAPERDRPIRSRIASWMVSRTKPSMANRSPGFERKQLQSMIFCTSLRDQSWNSWCSDSGWDIQDLPVIGSDIRFMSKKTECRLLRHSDPVNIPYIASKENNWKFWYYSFFSLRNSMHRLSVQQGFPNHFAHHAIPPFWRDKTSKKKNKTPRYFPPESNT